MIWGQIQPNKVNDESILDALAAVPREAFVPRAMRAVAYLDEEVKIADGRYIMAPMTLARLIEAADIQPSDLILEVGCGSGYEAAVLGQLGDAVIAVEEDAALVERATEQLQSAGSENVAVIEGKLSEGVPGQGPYQVIFINGAVAEVPKSLFDQLAEGGRLVVIRAELDGGANQGVGFGRGHLVVKSGGELKARNLFDAEAVLLPGFKKDTGFEF